MGDLLKFQRGEKMAKKPVDDRMSPEEWERFSKWINIPVAILTQLNGPEILEATTRRITELARANGERLPSRTKLPVFRK